MRHRKQFINITFFTFLIYLLFIDDSYAYIDPGAGSYLLQIILGFFIGVIFVIKIYWRRIKSFLGRIFKKSQNKDNL